MRACIWGDPYAFSFSIFALFSHRLETTKESGYNLRQTLDALRAETQQYEDAIAQTKREMEMIQRETQMSVTNRATGAGREFAWINSDDPFCLVPVL